MADALDKIRAGLDKARSKLAAHRLGGREHVVSLRNISLVGAVPDAGVPGLGVTLDAVIYPTPSCVVSSQYRWRDGGVTLLGDALVTKISRANYDESDIIGASSILIDGNEYSLVAGTLKVLATEFQAILKRRQ